MQDFDTLLKNSATAHGHLCPGQVVGVRMAMLGCRLIGLDEPTRIDWPTIYYLNDRYGCRVDLVTIRPRARLLKESFEIDDRQLYLHRCHVPFADPAWTDSLEVDLFSDRRPDIVIFGHLGNDSLTGKFKEYLLELPTAPELTFNILKIYQHAVGDMTPQSDLGRVILNGREQANRYADRIDAEVPFFYPWYSSDQFRPDKLIHYTLIRKELAAESPEVDFLSGINPSRVIDITMALPARGPMKATFVKQSRKFATFFNASRRSFGKKKVEQILSGYRELRNLSDHRDFAADSIAATDYLPYLHDLMGKAEKAALHAVGATWEGRTLLHDSPHGPKLKFNVSISANGPKEVRVTNVRFHPYWDTTIIVLDDEDKTIQPHQSLVREYLIDIERTRLEAPIPESLLFSAEIVYGQIPLQVYSILPVWEAPKLGIAFDPDFRFVLPPGGLDGDRIVSSMNWKLIITKPYDYTGKVKINLEPPRGLFAGAYRQELMLDAGTSRETVRVPFSISNLFEQGIQQASVTLSVDNRPVTSTKARIRIAACHVAETIKIGFMPDTTGLLEDLLRMTDATITPLTDRMLVTGDLFPYNVIIVGSAAFRGYPSFRKVSDRIDDYLRNGGSIVVFGQPDDWPEGALPISLVPDTEEITGTDAIMCLQEARLLSQPYKIDQAQLLANFGSLRPVAAADIAPAERLLVTASGGTLISVSRIGDGQVIFCGMPLLEMASELKLEAIHLLANLLNY